jgi:hypothetical protein
MTIMNINYYFFVYYDSDHNESMRYHEMEQQLQILLTISEVYPQL